MYSNKQMSTESISLYISWSLTLKIIELGGSNNVGSAAVIIN